jgi:hypothetical protein
METPFPVTDKLQLRKVGGVWFLLKPSGWFWRYWDFEQALPWVWHTLRMARHD